MGATLSVIKTLIVPAVISLILFLLSTYVLIPFWRKWRSRYSQYLPIDSISTSTMSLRQRVQNGIARMMVPSTWRRNAHERVAVATESSDDGFLSEEGRELGELDHGRRDLSDQWRRDDSLMRLTRELEEGFRDDSDHHAQDGVGGHGHDSDEDDDSEDDSDE